LAGERSLAFLARKEIIMPDGLINLSFDPKAFDDMVSFRKEMSELIIFLQCLETASDDRIKYAFRKLEEMKEARSA
jgi:hypothetical protein